MQFIPISYHSSFNIPLKIILFCLLVPVLSGHLLLLLYLCWWFFLWVDEVLILFMNIFYYCCFSINIIVLKYLKGIHIQTDYSWVTFFFFKKKCWYIQFYLSLRQCLMFKCFSNKFAWKFQSCLKLTCPKQTSHIALLVYCPLPHIIAYLSLSTI